MKLPVPIVFDWNEGNIDKNWKKHNVYYREAEEVFFNKSLRIYKDIRHSGAEERFTALGITNQKRKLYSTFTIRNEAIRIISARDQSKNERRVYEEKKTST